MPHPTNLLCERWQSPIRPGGKEHLTKVSTAITAGRVVSIDSNGYVVHWTTGEIALGVALESKASSDATTAPIAIDFIHKGDIFRLTAAAAPVQSDVGELCDVDGNGKVDLTASTNDDVYVYNLIGSGVNDVLVTFRNTAL